MKLAGSQKDLLKNLLFDHKKNTSKLYSAGPYWDYKTKKILYWLEKKGLKDFRGLGVDLDSNPISLVCKAVSANGLPTVKISDDLGKTLGQERDLNRYKRIFS